MMEKAKWNENTYIATEVADYYPLEKKIRIASENKELYCIDPECPTPILRYCNGPSKIGYFAHLQNCACDYAKFYKESTKVMKNVKQVLYKSFASRNFDIQLDVKLLPHHYTHLLFTFQNGKKVVLELGTERTTAKTIDSLTVQYANIGIECKWIVISNLSKPIQENKEFFIKRYLLNESKRNDVLILNKDGTEITQFIVDPNHYLYREKKIYLDNYPDTYSETRTLTDLTFEDYELTVEEFHKRYNEWLIKKKKSFEDKIAQIQRESLMTISHQPSYNYVKTRGKSKSVTTYEERKASIIDKMSQQKYQVRDQIGVRWICCKECGCVETDDKFSSYGGSNELNLGVCYECVRKKRE